MNSCCWLAVASVGGRNEEEARDAKDGGGRRRFRFSGHVCNQYIYGASSSSSLDPHSPPELRPVDPDHVATGNLTIEPKQYFSSHRACAHISPRFRRRREGGRRATAAPSAPRRRPAEMRCLNAKTGNQRGRESGAGNVVGANNHPAIGHRGGGVVSSIGFFFLFFFLSLIEFIYCIATRRCFVKARQHQIHSLLMQEGHRELLACCSRISVPIFGMRGRARDMQQNARMETQTDM